MSVVPEPALEQRDVANVGGSAEAAVKQRRVAVGGGGTRTLVLPLPSYDVRVRRELAHRRFMVSMLRQATRLVSLHALDAVVVAAAALFAAWLSETAPVTTALPALIAFMLLGLNARGSYRSGEGRRDAQRIVTGAFIALLLAALPGTLPLPVSGSWSFIGVFGLAAIAGLIVERRFVDAIVHQAYLRGFGLRRALIVTRPHEAEDVLKGVAPDPRSARRGDPDDQYVVGFVTPEPSADPRSLGDIGRIDDLIESQSVSELLVATSLSDHSLARMAEVCFASGVRVLVIPPAAHSFNGWSELTRIGRWPAYQLHPPRLELPALAMKRASDLVLASLGIVLLAPLMVLIAIAIKLESRGPVIFRQKRVGLGGREFMMWKFRSMLHGAEKRRDEIAHLNHYGDLKLFKLPQDPRITRVGRLLRRFSLDELPQLLNVLAGDMSLVGPRPPLPSEVKCYETRHYVRLSVVPGLTGPWQVNGRNLITDFEEVVRLERDYIERWSLRSDMEIILRTLGVVLSGKGAY